MIPVRVPAVSPAGRVVSVVPITPGHPVDGTECPACGEPIEAPAPLVLVLVGIEPAARTGSWVTGGAVAVHADCYPVPPGKTLDELAVIPFPATGPARPASDRPFRLGSARPEAH